MKKTIEIIALSHFLFQGFMPLMGAFVYVQIIDKYNWIAAIIGFLGSIIYSAYLINHYSVSRSFLQSIFSIILPIFLISYECYVSESPLSSFFLKTAFVNLCALTFATSIPLLMISFSNVYVLPGALILGSISVGIFFLLYFTAGYLSPENINQSIYILLSAVILETVRTVISLFGIGSKISLESPNSMTNLMQNSGSNLFQINKSKYLVKYHDQIMIVIGATSFCTFFILLIL